MSKTNTLVLQVGQGGNQYGLAFFDTMARASSIPSEFFQEGERGQVPQARALLVDMEPKVVAGVTKKAEASNRWRYGPKHRFTLDSGSGNNWAAGYCSGVEFHEPLLQQVRLQVESCDSFGGFLTIQSLAGGTGAGFGAYILELLKDEYPSSCIFSHCICPYQSGEVVVQSYNVLLTLAKLQEVADGIITVQNEALAATCKKSLGVPRPSFAEMNEVGAHSLASVLLPSKWRPVQSQPSSSHQTSPLLNVRLFSDLAYALCAHPGYRILGLYSTPQVRPESADFNTFTWSAQLRQLKRMVYQVELDQIPGEKTLKRSVQKSVASLLVLRGAESRNADVNMFSVPSLYTSWCADPLNVAVDETGLGLCPMVAGVMSNCQAAIQPAAKALSRAYSMFFSRAYLHQYFQYGLDKDFFETAFSTVEEILLAYKNL